MPDNEKSGFVKNKIEKIPSVHNKSSTQYPKTRENLTKTTTGAKRDQITNYNIQNRFKEKIIAATDATSQTFLNLNLPLNTLKELEEKKTQNFFKALQERNTIKAVEYGYWFSDYEKAAHLGVQISGVGAGNIARLGQFGKVIQNLTEQSLAGKKFNEIDFLDASNKAVNWKGVNALSVITESAMDVTIKDGLRIVGLNKTKEEFAVDWVKKTLVNNYNKSPNPLIQQSVKIVADQPASALKKKIRTANDDSKPR